MKQELITKEIVNELFEKRVLLSANILKEKLSFIDLAKTELPDDLLVLNKDNSHLK